jgi:hypothetical protein
MALMMVMFGFGAAPAADRAAPSDVASRSGTPPPAFVVHRQLEAAVSRVNRDVGTLLLKTDAGRVTLNAAPEAAAALRKGDRVVIDVAILRHPDPAQIPRERRTPAPLLVQRLTAEVRGIRHSVGVVALKTSAGKLDVDLPAPAIAALRTGDRLPVEVSIFLEPDAAALSRMERERAGLAAFLLSIFGRGK